MLEDLRLLVELQGLDGEIYAIEKDRERLPRLVALAGEGMRAAEADRDEVRQAAEAAAKGKRDAEQELQSENEHLRKLKLRSSEIKTNKEYFAHLKEIEDCQKKVSKLEETSLELMEKLEKAEAEAEAKNAAAGEEEKKFLEAKAGIEKKFEDGDKRLELLRYGRGNLLPRIKKEVLDYYEAMRAQQPESAVVEAKNGMCTGCRMILPPQIFNNVRKGEGIVKCNNCRRILYFKG